MNQIDSTRLKEILNYDPITGIFTWRETGKGKKRITAGCFRDGYISINIEKKRYQAHRLALIYVYGECTSHDVDHINGIKTDNRIVNLRPATRSENKQNIKKIQPNNKSGYMGVDFHKSTGFWRATITTMSKQKHIGLYKTPEEAHQAYLTTKRAIHPFSTV